MAGALNCRITSYNVCYTKLLRIVLRQVQLELGAGLVAAHEIKAPTVPADQLGRDCEAKPGTTFLDPAREGLEEVLFRALGQTGAGILHADPVAVGLVARADLDRAGLARRLDRLTRIVV